MYLLEFKNKFCVAARVSCIERSIKVKKLDIDSKFKWNTHLDS